MRSWKGVSDLGISWAGLSSAITSRWTELLEKRSAIRFYCPLPILTPERSIRSQTADKMMAMRCLLGLVYCLSLAAADVTQLRELQKTNRIFELRDALRQPGWNDSETLFYRAVTKSRFGNETAAIQDLRKFLAAHPSPDMERRADEELASALVRMGRYGDSALALADALRLTSHKDHDRADTENTRALYESLKDVAPQTIRFEQETSIEARHNELGSWNVPLEVNGKPGEWIFDTGANLSTMSESEAARLGLSIRESTSYVKGSTE